MATSPSLGAIVGLDGVNPIYNPSSTWKIWNINEIYRGQNATGKYIPNVSHMVYEIIGARVYRYIVKSINWENGVAELIREQSDNQSGMFNETDILIGLDGGRGLSTYICYIDKTTSPYRITVDQRCFVPGSMVTKCKLFKGNLLTNDGEVISRVYDTSGRLSGEDIPMEIAGTIQISDAPVVENRTIKTIRPAYTTVDIKTGEFLTAVFYSDEGYVASKQQLVVVETSFIKPTDAGTKYITDISLRSPFIPNTQERLVKYPLNVPLAGLNLFGVVHYSNGDKKEFPVDGTRFRIMGFDNFVATQVGQRFPLVLSYTLGENEHNYSAVVGSGRHVSVNYEAVTQPVDGMYGVKLFCYPVWVDSISGYRLEWFLYNLNRNICINVTPHVLINTSLTPYNPKAYGQLQNLSVSINLKAVGPQYQNYIHTQVVGIVIEHQGTERLTNWTLIYTPGQTPLYGPNLYAAAYSLGTRKYRVNLRADCTNQADWLKRLYTASQPLTNPMSEISPPEPTHFELLVDGTSLEYPIYQWDSEIVVNREVANSSTVFVRFIRRTGNTDLQLSIAGLPVYHVDENNIVLA
jgi:hypothetical protein